MHKWLEDFAPDVTEHVELNDYGDLKLLLTHFKNGHLHEVDDVKVFVDELQNQRVVDGDLQIRNWRDS